jgi:hypothetical protein
MDWVVSASGDRGPLVPTDQRELEREAYGFAKSECV